jgi:hypothetical protein
VEPGKCYDFFINNFKVQEKVCQNYGNSIYANLSKSNGRNKRQSYDKGDNDFYWLHFPDKKNYPK